MKKKTIEQIKKVAYYTAIPVTAVLAAAAGAWFAMHVLAKRYCKVCNAWIPPFEDKCPYCGAQQ